MGCGRGSDGIITAKGRSLPGILRHETNLKCLILTSLILASISALFWCRLSTITKLTIDYDAFPITRYFIHNQRWDMYVFIRESKFSSIGYKVGARFRLSYKYINVPCLFIILSFISALKMHKTITRVTKSTRLKMSYFIMHFQR